MNTLCKTIAAAVLASSIAMTATQSVASSVLQQSVDVLAKSSDLVFEGRVVGIRSEEENKKIYTYVTFEINDVVRGKYAQDTVELRYLGGTSNGITMSVGDMTIPSYGEHGVYFVEKLGGNTVHPLRGWGQGHFLVKQGSNGASMYNSQGLAITALKSGKTASQSSALQINNHTAAGVSLDSGTKKIMDLGTFKDSIRGLE